LRIGFKSTEAAAFLPIDGARKALPMVRDRPETSLSGVTVTGVAA
jgi:hypothetical protein